MGENEPEPSPGQARARWPQERHAAQRGSWRTLDPDRPHQAAQDDADGAVPCRRLQGMFEGSERHRMISTGATGGEGRGACRLGGREGREGNRIPGAATVIGERVEFIGQK